MITNIETNGTLQPNTKRAWIKHLRSGKYIQGKGALKDEGKYCCLGVLCDMKRLKQIPTPGGPIRFNYKGESANYYLPRTLLEEMDFIGSPNFTLYWGYWVSAGRHYSLSELNDAGLTFDQIADVIDYFF